MSQAPLGRLFCLVAQPLDPPYRAIGYSYTYRIYVFRYRKVSRCTPQIRPIAAEGRGGRGLSQLKLLSGGCRAIRGIAEIVSLSRFNGPLSFFETFRGFSAIHLWGRLGRGHCRKFSAISANFPQTFRRIFASFPGAINVVSASFPQNVRRISAKFPQKPFVNDPIS